MSFNRSAAKEADDPRATPGKDSDAGQVKAELREMRGTWTTSVTEAKIVDGKPLPPREQKTTFVISADKPVLCFSPWPWPHSVEAPTSRQQ